MKKNALTIDVVERETGLSKELLRKWEARYGFPNPARDDQGRRLYTRPQVERLTLIKRLLLSGEKPAALLAMSTTELTEAAAQATEASCLPADETTNAVLQALRERPQEPIEHILQPLLHNQGLSRFVLDVAVPLNYAVGQAWVQGLLNVFHEHLFTEAITRLLKTDIARLPARCDAPPILLAAPPGENHTLGLLFVEALLTELGARCYSFGSGTPMKEIAAAAQVLGTRIVGLSFSAAYPGRNVAPLLRQLRQQLADDSITLWVGGAGAQQTKPGSSNVRLFSDLTQAVEAYRALLPPATGDSGAKTEAAS